MTITIASAKMSTGDKLKSYLQKTREFINVEIDKLGGHLSPSTDYPYWNFLPQYATTVKPDVSSGQFSSPCFGENKVSTSKSLDGMTYTISIQSSSPKSDGECTDDYAFLTAAAHTFQAVKQKSPSGTSMTTLTTLTLPSDLTEAEQWDVDTNGVRVFRFLADRITTLSNILVTIDMFLPQFTLRVPPGVAEKNIDFMRKYPQFDIQKRDASLAGAPPPAELVHSGDFFGIMRLDGLNPMLAWVSMSYCHLYSEYMYIYK
jgi:hypothetical protein